MNKRKAEKGLQSITKFLKSSPSSDRHPPGRVPQRDVNGSPQHAQILFTQPSSTEKNKSLSPGMKERMKQFFGVPIQKIGLGRGKDSPKTPEPGKTWSSNDYFTGAKSNDKQPSSDQAGSGLGQSTVSGIPDIDKKTPTSGNKDEDVMLGQRISVIGERNRPGERQSYRGASKFGVPKDGGVQQDRTWHQGRNLDVSNYREGNVDRRDMRLTPGREPNRGESTMKGGGVKTDKKPERNQMKSGDNCDDAKGRIASSQEVGLAYKDRFHPGDRSQYNNPNRTRDSQRYYGSPQNNSPRSQRDGRFDKNRGQHYRNSREEFEMGSRWHTENEYRKGRDTGNTFSPRDRNQGQFPSKSARPYSIGGYQNDYNDKPGRSSNRDLSGGSDWKAGEKRGNFDAASKLTNNPDIHYAQGDKIIPKSLNEPKEHSSQSSTSFQRTDQGATKSTMIDQDPNTGDSSLNESNCRTTEQKSDEARKQINNQGSMSSSNATGQKSDNEQDSQISKPGDNKKVEKEMEVSDYVSSSDDPEGQASSLQTSDKPKELSNKSSITFQRTDQKHVTAATMMEEQTPNINSKDSSLNKSDRKTTEQKIDVSRTKSEGQRSMLGTTAIQQKSDDVHTSPVVEKFRGSKRAETDMDISGYASGSNDKCGQDVSTQNRTSEQQHIKALSTQRAADRQISGTPGSKEFGNVSDVNKDKKKSIIPELSPKRQYSCEEKSPRQMRHSSGSSQGRGSQRDNDHKVKNRHRNFSGESTHSSDIGRARSHSRDKESHVKRSHTSHRSDHRRVGEEKSSESNINSDSSSGSSQLHSHRHRHRQKGDNSNGHRHRSRGDSSPKSDNRHRHRSRGDSTPKSDKKESSRQSSKEMGTSATGQSSDRLRDGDLSGLRHRKLGNATDRWKAEEDYAGGSDVDIDEEDSDDELETPFFLTSLTEASSRPIPSTPTKGINASYTESPTPSCSPQISLAPLSSLTSGFSLDALLAEAIDKTSEERQCEDMHAVLEEGLRKGGFVKDTLEVNEESVVEEDLLPEHQLKLKKFEIYKSQMSEVHPGESVFLPQRYLCLFNADISLQACGFVPGTTYIDKHLSTVQPGDYITLLTSDIMLMCFDAISCHDAVLQWLLFIMSVHPSHLLINGCYKTIQEHLYACQHFTCKTKYTWSPAVTDILSILCNYGADPNKLLPSSLMPNTDSVRKSFFHQQNMEIQPAAGKYNRENFRLVLSSLAMAFQIRPKYTTVQITQMVVMLCKAALDKSLNNFMLTHEFEVVLASLLKLYTDTDWTSQSLILCRELSCLTEHHHNKVYLAQILPPTTKGNFLQRRVSFLMIHNLFYPEQKISDDVIIHFQLGRVHNVLPRLQGLADEDIYLLASCVSLLDLCIGNGIIKSAEKDDLEYITEQMKKLTGEVRDNVQMLDKTRIKDMMIRITSKWTLVLRSIGSKQRTLFECHGNFRKSPAEMKIETVDASQTDQASETEEEDSEEEDGHSEEEESVKQLAKVKTVTIDVKGKDASDSAAEERMEIGDDDDLPEL